VVEGSHIDVLLVEDNPGDARLVVEMLNESGSADFRLEHVTTVRDAVDRLSASGSETDAVLLDLSLPDESGLDTLRRIVGSAGRASVVVMTGAGDEELGMAAIEAGAQDYLVKGQVDGPRLRRALRFAIERNDRRLQLETLSVTDDLTGLHNRRGFLMMADKQLKVARRNQLQALLLFLDLDNMKDINDSCGHAEGNRALIEAADTLRACFRQSDILARLGGDEFAAFAIGAAVDQTEDAVRSRILAHLRTTNAKPDRPYALGFSVGVLRCGPEETVSVEDLLARADELMYRDKKDKKR
jgi:two-component system cell cycle response regulator